MPWRDVIAGLKPVARAHDLCMVWCLLMVRWMKPRRRGGARRCGRVGTPAATYDFGPGRSEWERVHGTAAELIATGCRACRLACNATRRHGSIGTCTKVAPVRMMQRSSTIFWQGLQPSCTNLRCAGEVDGAQHRG